MPRISIEARRRVIALKEEHGYSMSEIVKRLKEEGIVVSRQALYKLLHKFHTKSCLGDLPKHTRKRKLTQEMTDAMDEALQQNDELTARQLCALLLEQWPDTHVSLSRVKRVRQQIGWVSTHPHYCQLRKK